MKNLKPFYNFRSPQSNSIAATFFGMVVTALLIGGYEAAQTDGAVTVTGEAQQAQVVVQMEPIVVTAKRI